VIVFDDMGALAGEHLEKPVAFLDDHIPIVVTTA
jgi:hypothetical protein